MNLGNLTRELTSLTYHTFNIERLTKKFYFLGLFYLVNFLYIIFNNLKRNTMYNQLV